MMAYFPLFCFAVLVVAFVFHLLNKRANKFVGTIRGEELFYVYSLGLFKRKVYMDRFGLCHYEDGSRTTISDACAVMDVNAKSKESERKLRTSSAILQAKQEVE